MRHLHVIPVPHDLSAVEAWKQICIFGRLVDPPEAEPDCVWATIPCDGQECGADT